MGFYDRHYQTRPGNIYGGNNYGGQRMGNLGFPSLTPMVKKLIIINVGVFALQLITQGRMAILFAASGDSPIIALQVWRLITFQFLHADIGHILFNMIGLYFFGTALERQWGGRHFLAYYLVCGVVGGMLYVLASLIGIFPQAGILVGASGGVLGLLAATAVLFPHAKVYLYFFIPIPIRILIAIITIGYVLNVLNMGPNAGGDICHLGGMATGFIWIFGRPFFTQWKTKMQIKMNDIHSEQERKLEIDVDSILAKVHEKGIGSLSQREKDILRKATNEKKGP